MSNFTLTDSGGLAAGQGIGEAIKAFALAGGARQRAELEAGLRGAQMNHNNASAFKANQEGLLLAERLGLARDPMKAAMLENGVPLDKRGIVEQYQQTGKFGPAYDAPADDMGPVQPPPMDPALIAKISKGMGLAMNANMTSSNVQQMANARGENLNTDIVQGVLNGTIDPTRGKQATFAGGKGGAAFDNVGTNGASINNATGEQVITDPGAREIFASLSAALASQRNTAATANNARAGASNAKAAATGGGAVDKDFNPATVRRSILAAYEKAYPLDMMRERPKGAPTLEQFEGEWLAKYNVNQDRYFNRAPGANKSPAPAAADAKILEAPAKAERKAGTVYQTPKGPMKWTGTGWLPT